MIAVPVELHLWASGNARNFITVGKPDTAVRESRERIKSALLNSGVGYPPAHDQTVRAIFAAWLKHLLKWHWLMVRPTVLHQNEHTPHYR